MLFLFGVFGILVGVIVGIGWVIDGINVFYVLLIVVGLLVLVGGVLIDFVFGAVTIYIGGWVLLLFMVRVGWLSVGFWWIRILGIRE